MKRILIDKEKNFFKANLHTHSVLSDGKLTPLQLKEEYKKRGYSVLAITDHEHLIDHSALNDDDFMMITGCEIAIKQFADQSSTKNLNMPVTHLNLYSLAPHNVNTPCYSSHYDHFINDSNRELVVRNGEFERVYSPEGINEIISRANEEGFLVSYNHPSWSLETACDYLNYDGLFAVEIFNTAAFNQYGYSDERVLDDFWRAGKPVCCVCADDAHNIIQSARSNAFGGWVQIAANKLDYKEIMSALKYGEFYASCGPEIYSLMIEDGKVKAEFSEAVSANLITDGRRGALCRAEKGEKISKAEFSLAPSDKYFRITVTDQNGKKAYTQVYEI